MQSNKYNPSTHHKYLLFYKPDGVLTQFSPSEGHMVLSQFISVKGVYPAGRLDLKSEGLLLLTNDGWLSHALTDPEKHLNKVYYVQVEGQITDKALQRLEYGLKIKGHLTLPCKAEMIIEPVLPAPQKEITPHSQTSWVRLTLHEGKKRQIRHMTAAIGYPTLRLVRVAIGPIGCQGLAPGQWREMSREEIQLLFSAIKKKAHL